jgi:hypothetical protein
LSDSLPSCRYVMHMLAVVPNISKQSTSSRFPTLCVVAAVVSVHRDFSMLQMSDSGDDLVLRIAAEGEDSDDGSPRAKRARPPRAAAGSAGGAAAAAGAAAGAAGVPVAGGGGGGGGAPAPAAEAGAYEPPPDLGVGAADGASQRTLLCLQQVNFQ